MRWRGVVVLLHFHPWFCDEELMLTKVNLEVPLKTRRVIFCPIFPDIRIVVSFGGYQVSSSCPSDKSRVVTRMRMEFGWKNTDKVKP
jgi:hypothetical protein